MRKAHEAWAVKWRSENALDGKSEHFIGRFRSGLDPVPYFVAGNRWLLFKTRKEARRFVWDHFGYIARRRDLKAEPHGWRMPIPVKIRMTIEEAA